MSDNLYASRINGGRFIKDPIVEEVRAARDAIASKFKYDIRALVENARKHQTKSGYKIIIWGK